MRDSTSMRLVQHADTTLDKVPRPVVTATTALEDLPEVLTIEEAAAVLRVSRTAAYELSRLWRASGGVEGLPVIRLGRSLRVSRADLFRLLHVQAGPEEPRPGCLVH